MELHEPEPIALGSDSFDELVKGGSISKSSARAKYMRYDVPVVSTSRSFLFSGLFDLPGAGGPCIAGYSSITCPNADCRS